MSNSDILAAVVLGLLAVNAVVGVVWFMVLHRRGHLKAKPHTAVSSAPVPISHTSGDVPAGSSDKVNLATGRAIAAATPAGSGTLQINTAALEGKAEASFNRAIDEATTEFKQQVGGSSQKLGDLMVRLTTNIVEKELEVYRTELAAARDAAIQSLKDMQGTIEAKQKELEQGVGSELDNRKQLLLQRLDARLGAAVAGYIVESLGQGVDLGAQRGYLLQSLESHKAELKKDLNDEL